MVLHTHDSEQTIADLLTQVVIILFTDCYSTVVLMTKVRRAIISWQVVPHQRCQATSKLTK